MTDQRHVLSASEAAECGAEAGGKGTSLGELVGEGFAVPKFFVVSARAHRAMAGRDFTESFLAELREAYEEIGGDGVALAVRSSAIGEDSGERSFAGLYHTALGVRGFEEVLASLRVCWDSYDNPAAARYRLEWRQGDSGAEGGMGVVVQQLVTGAWSGVSFTANPVTLALSEVVINAVQGLGDDLMEGKVNPEEITVSRATGQVLGRVSVDAEARLPDRVVELVWRKSVEIADTRGFPQDVEWTIDGDQFVALQARPITTIATVFYDRFLEPWRASPEGGEDPQQVWTRGYGDEVWTSPESPCNYGVRNPAGRSAGWFGTYLPMHGDTLPLPDACAKYFQAAAYAHVGVLKRVYEYHPRIARVPGILNFFPPSMRAEVQQAPWRWQGRLRRHWRLETQNREVSSLFRNYKYLPTMWGPLIERSDTWFDTDLDGLSLESLRAHLATEVLPEAARVGGPCAIGVLWHSCDLTFLLTGLLECWFGKGDVLYAEVSSGLDNSETVAEAQEIWRLAQLVKAAGPEAVRRVTQTDWSALESEHNHDLEQFRTGFVRFLYAHRHRGAAYKDIGYPRWGDNPDLLLGLVRTYLTSNVGSPEEQNRKQAQVRRRCQRDLLRKSRLHPLRYAVLQFLMHYNEIYMGIRNDHRFYFDRLWYAQRLVYLSMGRRLCQLGMLGEPEDVFFLGPSEIDDCFAGELTRREVDPRINVRRADWERTLMAQAPKYLRGYSPVEADTGAAGPGRTTISGIAASPGAVVGRARVIFRVEDLPKVEDGEILVTRQTDPGWTAVFGKIGGLVLETGGVLAHGTSLSREYGLPCVTAVERATSLIEDGSEIRIDGSEGYIEIRSASR